jgi:tRNA(His) guanylyltransferase
MMKEEKGVDFEDAVPKWAIEGCLIKREQYQHEGVDPRTGGKEITLRTRAKVVDRGVREFSADNLKLVTEKFW